MSALRLVSPQKLLNGLNPLRSILCVVAKENGQLGTAISDQYWASASPFLNTENPQDIAAWIRQHNIGGVVFALPQTVQPNSRSNSHDQRRQLLELREKILSEQSWEEAEQVSVCTVDHQLDREAAAQAAREEAELWDDVDPNDPSASTDAAIALKHFFVQQRHY
eukprot:CAMPEP_0172455214 /NCGR_PEP_ID=MMETSP1065-20121228/11955_1 /TAXON_ID=265537 /ORGANISM="Amphiprora paludosa, Strain CCMP125" /LENGTH=164 /DNA_ID=CAMNT_0013207673 /DNA_START=125 /DNA_END=619 /DNA_ORIENTATION=-